MTKHEAKQFITKLFTEVWDALNAENIPHFYHHDVVAQFGRQTAHYADIVHRLHYVKEHYDALKTDIQDVLTEDDKITVRLNQSYFKDSKAVKDYTLIAIYQVKDNKVARMWACIDPNVNYYEK